MELQIYNIFYLHLNFEMIIKYYQFFFHFNDFFKLLYILYKNNNTNNKLFIKI